MRDIVSFLCQNDYCITVFPSISFIFMVKLKCMWTMKNHFKRNICKCATAAVIVDNTFETWVGFGDFSKVMTTFSYVGGSFNLFMSTTGDVCIIQFNLFQFGVMCCMLSTFHVSSRTVDNLSDPFESDRPRWEPVALHFPFHPSQDDGGLRVEALNRNNSTFFCQVILSRLPSNLRTYLLC